MVELCGLQFARQLAGNRADDGGEDVGEPIVGSLLEGKVLEAVRRAPRVDVGEEARRLMLADVHARQAHELAVVVSRVDHLRLNDEVLTGVVRGHAQLGNVETEVVEAADTLADEVLALVVGNGFLGGDFVPQQVVLGADAVADVDRVGVFGEEPAGLQVHELADDVRAGQVDVVLALAVGELQVQFAGLGVDQVGGELARVAAEQGVRQGNVAPVEAQEMKAHEKKRQRVNESRRSVGAHRQREKRTVGQ